jgi:hypothetical protein
MKAHVWGLGVEIHVFLTMALLGSEWSALRPCCFNPEEISLGTHWIRDWGPGSGLFEHTHQNNWYG